MKQALQRAWEQASIYLPVLLMALLAMGTWWLVRNAPQPLRDAADQVLTDDPDYVMEQFAVYQYEGGERLQSILQGDEARHLPKSDLLEVDGVRTHSVAPDGVVTTTSARRGISNADSSEVQLLGNAEIERRSPEQAGQTTRYRGDFLHAWPNEERVESHLPVVIEKGNNRFTGDRMKYDNLSETVELNGRVKGIIYPGKK